MGSVDPYSLPYHLVLHSTVNKSVVDSRDEKKG